MEWMSSFLMSTKNEKNCKLLCSYFIIMGQWVTVIDPWPTWPSKNGDPWPTDPFSSLVSGVDPNFPSPYGRNLSPEAPRAGVGFLGRGSEPPPWGEASSPSPPARGSGAWGSAVSSPSGVRGGSPENLKFGAIWDLEIHYRNALLQKS